MKALEAQGWAENQESHFTKQCKMCKTIAKYNKDNNIYFLITLKLTKIVNRTVEIVPLASSYLVLRETDFLVQ